MNICTEFDKFLKHALSDKSAIGSASVHAEENLSPRIVDIQEWRFHIACSSAAVVLQHCGVHSNQRRHATAVWPTTSLLWLRFLAYHWRICSMCCMYLHFSLPRSKYQNIKRCRNLLNELGATKSCDRKGAIYAGGQGLAGEQRLRLQLVGVNGAICM